MTDTLHDAGTGTIVAAIQLRADGTLASRLDRVTDLCKEAAQAGAKLLVLPENFAYYGEKDLGRRGQEESTPQGLVRSTLARISKDNRVWIVGGTIPISASDSSQSDIASPARPFARAMMFSPEGETGLHYDKMHLFDVDVTDKDTGKIKAYRESSFYRPGSGDTLIFDSPAGKTGVMVCYDTRFPGMALSLASQGARLLAIPAAFTRQTGKAHWQLLLQARALDTLCYVVGANLAGRDHPRQPTWGGSTIVDPWGQIIAEMDDEEGFICSAIYTEMQNDVRARLPLSDHRRL
ncbi:MAG: carbon-nitrogen hydrolase family protein [bacterium]